MREADRILELMVVTEKATGLTSNANQYTFKVHPSSNRIEVAQAVEKTFGVKVRRVNIQNVKPKIKQDRTRKGRIGSKGGYKKAIVSLREGDHIEVI